MYIIGVVSGKGGVGKTTCVLGLALALQELGHKVGIIDLDLESSSLGDSTGLSRQKLVMHDLIQPIDFHGIKAASLSMFAEAEWEDVPTLIDEERKHSLINQLFHSVDWGELDYIIADLPPGSGEEIRGLLKRKVRGLIMVASKQRLSEMPIRRLIRMCREQYMVPILGIIENDCYNQDGGTGERLVSRYNLPLLAKIPNDPGIAKAMDNGDALSTKHFISAAHIIQKETKDEQCERPDGTGHRPRKPKGGHKGDNEGETRRPDSATESVQSAPRSRKAVPRLAQSARRGKVNRGSNS